MDYLVNVLLIFIILYQIRTIYLGYKAPNVIPEEIQVVKKETKGKMQIIDVRSAGRFQKGHIKGSKNLNLGTLYKQLDKLPKDKKLILVSQNGTQTGRTVAKLIKDGYDAVNLKGGYRAWTKYQRD